MGGLSAATAENLRWYAVIGRPSVQMELMWEVLAQVGLQLRRQRCRYTLSAGQQRRALI